MKLTALTRTARVDGAWGGDRVVYLKWIEERIEREEPLRNFVVCRTEMAWYQEGYVGCKVLLK